MEDVMVMRLACDECGADESCYISELNSWIEWTCQKCGHLSYEPNDSELE